MLSIESVVVICFLAVVAYFFLFREEKPSVPATITTELGIIVEEKERSVLGYPIQTSFFLNMIPLLEQSSEFIDIMKKYKNVVDLGCGPHYTYARDFFAKLGLVYTGVDLFIEPVQGLVVNTDMLSFIKGYTDTGTMFIISGIDDNIISRAYAEQVVKSLEGMSVTVFYPYGSEDIISNLRKSKSRKNKLHTINRDIFIFEA